MKATTQATVFVLICGFMVQAFFWSLSRPGSGILASAAIIMALFAVITVVEKSTDKIVRAIYETSNKDKSP